ncbi:MAG: lipopolysaccharide biosynthesis protein [Bacteroidota bacterium]
MPIKLRQNELLRNILALMGGTSLAQVIPIALQPLLRRLYEPEVFGVYSLYLSYIAIVVVISSLKYEMSIVIQKEDRKAINIAALAMLSSFVVNTLLLIFGVIFYDQLTGYLKFPEGSGWWMLFIPVSAWLLSSYQVLNYWLVRKKAFFIISTNKIARRSAEGFVHTGFGFIKYGPGMLIGDIIGNVANVIAGIYQSIKNGLQIEQISFRQMADVAKEQSEFPKYQALPALLTTISISLPVIIVTKYFGVLETSFFDLSRMVLLVPSTLIAAAVSQVLFQNISERIQNRRPISGLLFKVSGMLGGIAILVVIVMLLAGPFLFDLVFNESYRISGEYAKILSVAFMFPFIVSPISMTLTALKKLKTLAAWQVGYFAIMLALLFTGFEEVEDFYLLFTIVNIFAYSVYWILAIIHALQHDKHLAA